MIRMGMEMEIEMERGMKKNWKREIQVQVLLLEVEFFGYHEENNWGITIKLRLPWEDGVCGNFMADVKIRGFPSKAPSLSISPWKKSNLIYSRAKIKATAQNFCPY